MIHMRNVRKVYDTGEVALDGANVEADAALAGHEAACVLTDDESCWIPEEKTDHMTVTLRWPRPVRMDRLVIREQLDFSQRVESYRVEVWREGQWEAAAQGKVIGHKRIIRLPGEESKALRLVITDARTVPALAFIGVYQEL